VTPRRSVALLFLVLTAILWSAGGLLIKLVSLNPIAIAGLRSIIAALLILCFIKKPDFRFTPIKFAAAFMYAATVISFVCATKMTTAANAIIIQYTAPIYVIIFGALFLKEKVKWYDVTTIFIILGGMILFFIDKLSLSGLMGNLMAAFSGIAFAFTILLLKLQKDDSPLNRIFWGNVLTAIIAIPFMFQAMPDTKSLIGIGLLGVFQLGFSYILFTIAIKNVSALEAVLIPMIEPILNPIWVAIFLNEIPSVFSIFGGLIVVSIITLRCTYIYVLPKNNVNG
jgi:drug/metabolite transporter (DMT)-like permease